MLDVERFVQALPKAELHLHLEGSIRPDIALTLAARAKVPIRHPRDGRALVTSDEFHDVFQFQTFGDFLRLYVQISGCLGRADDFALIVDDLAQRLVEQGVRYAEVTFTPWTHVARGVEPAEIHVGLAEGLAMARDRGVALRWVFDVVRSTPDQAEPTVSFAMEHERQQPGAVVGVGVGGPEAGQFEMAPIVAAFAKARSAGFKSLPHAGELAGAESVRFALEALQADRIGHGVRCLEDASLVDELRDRAIPLEVCPTSNVCLGVASSLAEHPLPALMDAGVAVSLGSDDPTFFNTDLCREYVGCAQAYGWGPNELRSLARAAIEHSFMDDTLAQAMLAELDG